MRKLLISIGLLVAVAAQARERVLWDFEWEFCRGAETSSWRAVELPHDWSIERVPGTECLFDQKYDQGSGCLPGGIGWYRKMFTLPASAKGQRVFVEFEGVYMNSDVWLNGQHLGNRPYGYIGFEYDLTPFLKWDAPNELLVRANVEQPCSRWLSGAGIYRHVWLTTTKPVYLTHWGAYVTTPKITSESADVRVRAAFQNQNDVQKIFTGQISILDPDGRRLVSSSQKLIVEAGKRGELDAILKVATPKLWSLNSPTLYTVRVELIEPDMLRDTVIDRVDTPFGIRTIEFTKDRGFFLNGEHVDIKGVCNHHDQGYLGAAAFDRAIERQLEILKKMGCNAIRTSHNPPAPRLLELCDRMGFVVLDEAFDEWSGGKTSMGYARFFDKWSERDIRDMVRRDRNHPSIVLWSIGNEIFDLGTGGGTATAKRLADFVHDEDSTRPVTCACHNPGDTADKVANALDLLGLNYKISDYELFKGKYTLIASETVSARSSRGEYNLVLNDGKDGRVSIEKFLNNHASSYGIEQSENNDEASLKALHDHPWVAGEFVWTGFDYIGEPSPFPWPSVSSYFGIMDLCGFPKDRFYLYQSRWTDAPMAHLLPHWNWPQFTGKEIPVWCYSNGDTVELFLNDNSLGEKKMSDCYHQEWSVPYTPGNLKVIAKRAGQIVATDEVVTTGAPANLEVSIDRQEIAANGQDLAYVTVRVLDAAGRLCPDADNLIHFDVTGAGKLVAVGNGNPVDHGDFQTTDRKAFHGLALGIVKAGKSTGASRVTVRGDGLPAVGLGIKTR
ncbi:MAG: DUF4982 domain-containing protein [Verrucomicrobia bacterium]|nr:DUF4982 domain-containing protein [Verrucomicrobiota bacterium]